VVFPKKQKKQKQNCNPIKAVGVGDFTNTQTSMPAAQSTQ
jgi:hypothetical protein